MPITADIQLLPLEALGASGKNYGASGISNRLGPLDGSGMAFQHSTGAVVLPALQVDMEVSLGGFFSADFKLPQLQVEGGGGASSEIELPMLTVAATGTVVPQATAEILLPMLTVAATGTVSGFFSAAIRLPQLTVEMRVGSRGAAVLPQLVVAGSISTMERGTLAATLPLLQVLGTLSVESYPAHGAIILPALLAGPYGSATIILPSLQVVAYSVLNTTDFEGWVMNVRTGGITRLTNYPFTQFVNAGNKTYAVGADGLYLLGGDDDDGDPIEWQFETGLSDLGRVGVKHIPYLYLDGIIEGVVEIVLIDDRGREFAYHYNTKQRGAVHLKHRRKLGNGIRTTNMAFRIKSDSGAYLELDALEPEITVTQRSI